MSDDLKPEPIHVPRAPRNEPTRRLDDPRIVDRIVYAVYGIAVLLILIDPLIEKHGPFDLQHWFGFYGFYSLVCCVLLVLAAGALRKLLMRPEDYYDR